MGTLTRTRTQMTVLRVKEKLQTHVGSSVGAMRLLLRDESGATVSALEEDGRKLGFYSPRDGFTLHVVDTDAGSASAAGWLEDVSKVEKFELSEEAYEARGNTYRKFKEEQRRTDPGWTLEKELARRRGVRLRVCQAGLPALHSPPLPSQEEPAAAAEPADEQHQAAEASLVALGARCEVQPGGKRGVVAYVGNAAAPGLPKGYWVGVRFDEPVGRNDGSVGGTRFFDCPPAYGGLVRPAKVTTGNFPELDLFASDDEM